MFNISVTCIEEEISRFIIRLSQLYKHLTIFYVFLGTLQNQKQNKSETAGVLSKSNNFSSTLLLKS